MRSKNILNTFLGIGLFFFASFSITFLIDQAIENQLGSQAYKDQFALTDFTLDELDEEYIANGSQVLGESTSTSEFTFRGPTVEYTLTPEDYYWGKYINASSGAREINTIPVLTPGTRIRTIADGYITLWRSRGYVQAQTGYFYGSGLCWSTTALGGVMDKANTDFENRWGIPLFVYEPGDRRGHRGAYSTYKDSNGGHGYTVIKYKWGGGQDYSFTVNPDIDNVPELQGLKIKIMMTYTEDHPEAYRGQSIGGYILTNKNIF